MASDPRLAFLQSHLCVPEDFTKKVLEMTENLLEGYYHFGMSRTVTKKKEITPERVLFNARLFTTRNSRVGVVYNPVTKTILELTHPFK